VYRAGSRPRRILGLRPGAAGALVGAALLAGGADATAQRLYIGFEEGGPRARTTSSSQTFLNHPTRCDTLLYPEGLTPPDDPACDAREANTSLTNSFDIGSGFGYGSTVGLSFGAIRAELDFRMRGHGRDTRPIKVAGGDEALTARNVEWAVPPTETLSDVRADELFLNLYYDFENRTRWTPYLGAGMGLAQIDAHFAATLVRKPERDYLAIEFAPDWPEEAKRAAAGTVSLLNAEMSGWVPGFQVITGLDMNLGELLLGIKVRWGRFGELSTTTEYDVVSSHAPVQADGVTPFAVDVGLGGLGYREVALVIKYYF
jgi:opacity protein-like surface antigen